VKVGHKFLLAALLIVFGHYLLDVAVCAVLRFLGAGSLWFAGAHLYILIWAALWLYHLIDVWSNLDRRLASAAC